MLYPYGQTRIEPILAAVGALQFEVVKYRLESEYNVRTVFRTLPYTTARRVAGAAIASADARLLERAPRRGLGRPSRSRCSRASGASTSRGSGTRAHVRSVRHGRARTGGACVTPMPAPRPRPSRSPTARRANQLIRSRGLRGVLVAARARVFGHENSYEHIARDLTAGVQHDDFAARHQARERGDRGRDVRAAGLRRPTRLRRSARSSVFKRIRRRVTPPACTSSTSPSTMARCTRRSSSTRTDKMFRFAFRLARKRRNDVSPRSPRRSTTCAPPRTAARRRASHAGITSRRSTSGPARAVSLKAENLQRIGAFKFRGAYNAIAQLDATSGARRRRVLEREPRAGRRAGRARCSACRRRS